MKLTALQLDVLNQLDGKPRTPMELGGRDGSGHSSILAALARKGLVEKTVRSPGVRGSYYYAITTDGDRVRRDANQQVKGGDE